MADHLTSFPPAIERIQRATLLLIRSSSRCGRPWWRFDLEFLSSELMCPPTGDEISDEPYFEKM
jgi:hypothetical protein